MIKNFKVVRGFKFTYRTCALMYKIKCFRRRNLNSDLKQLKINAIVLSVQPLKS
jgi:hypothetical protein